MKTDLSFDPYSFVFGFGIVNADDYYPIGAFYIAFGPLTIFFFEEK